MKQIKTVINSVEHAQTFDKAVNDLLKDGWMLLKRDIISISGEITEAFNTMPIKALYAELERYEPQTFEEITL
jgi:hypothetical protein